MTEQEFLSNLVYIRDSREKAGFYTFPGRAVKVIALPVSDYSIMGLHEPPDMTGCERKTLDDLAGTLSTGRERFERSLEKAANTCRHYHLIIEGSLEDVAKGKYRSNMSTKAIIQTLVCYSIRFNVKVWFCGSREYGQRITESILEKAAREYWKKFSILAKRK